MRKYDSATFRLRSALDLPGLGKVSGPQSSRPIHVLVQRRVLVMCWPEQTVECIYPCPPVPISDTGVSCCHESLDVVPSVAPFQNVADDILATADLSMDADGSDGAFGNLKYQAWRDVSWRQSCGNHDINLSDGLVENLMDKEVIQQLTSFITMLRTGGFFVRLISILYPVILQLLKLILDDLPHPDVHISLLILRRHLTRNFHRYKRSYEKGNIGVRALAAYEAAWDSFLFWWNGDTRTAGILFHHLGLSRHRYDMHLVASGMAKSMSGLIFRSVPSRPEEGKWTKTPPAIDFIVLLLQPVGIAKALLDAASKAIRITTTTFDGNWSALSWSEAQGVRHKQSKELLLDELRLFKIHLMMVLFMATRVLTYFFLLSSKDLHSPTAPIMLMELLYEASSPVIAVLQFLALVSIGRADVVRLLWHPRYSSFDEWISSKPEEAILLRVSTYMLSASLHRRHIAPNKKPLMQLLCVADDRRSVESRKATVDDLGGKLQCCVGKFVVLFSSSWRVHVHSHLSGNEFCCAWRMR